VIDKLSNAAHPVVDRIASGVHVAVDKVAGAAGQAAETLGVKGTQFKNAQGRALEECRGFVRDNPVKAVAVGVAAGFLLSRLLSWSSR